MTDTTKPNEDYPPVFDYADFLERIDGDVDLLKEVIEIFLEDTPRLLFDLYTAIEREDFVAAERAAHTLKGAAANISACRLYAISQQVQQAVKEKNRDILNGMTGLFEDNYQQLERELRGYVEK